MYKMDDQTSKHLEVLAKRFRDKYTPEELENFILMGHKIAGKPVLHLLMATIEAAADGFPVDPTESGKNEGSSTCDGATSNASSSSNDSATSSASSSSNDGVTSNDSATSNDSTDTTSEPGADTQDMKTCVYTPEQQQERRRKVKKLIARIRAQIPFDYAIPSIIEFNEIAARLNICLSLVPMDYKTDISIPDEKYAPDVLYQYEFLKNTAIAFWVEFCRKNPKLVAKLAKFAPDVDFSQIAVDAHNPTVMYFTPKSSKRIGIFCYYTDANGKPFYKTTPART